MRNLLEDLRTELAEFLSQRDDHTLLVACSDDDAALALRLLSDLDAQDESDVFLLFSGRFEAPGAWVDGVLSELAERRRLASEALVGEGRPPLAPLPSGLSNPRQEPAARLREAMSWARELLPREGGHRLVWAMIPLELQDPEGWTSLVASLAPRQEVEPWMRGVRAVLRAPWRRGEPLPAPRAPRVRVRPLDLSPQALEAAIEREVEDENLSVDARMQALLSLAFLDHARGRPALAAERFGHLLGYYQHAERPALSALVMHGLGEVHRGQANLPEARRWYECALDAAASGESPVVLANVAWSLGSLSFEEARFSDAERYFDAVDRLAQTLLDPELKARALEWRGLSQERQGSHGAAAASWEAAAKLCRAVGLTPYLRAALGHLKRMYRALGVSDRASAADAELRALDQEAS